MMATRGSTSTARAAPRSLPVVRLPSNTSVTADARSQDCGVGAHGWPTSARNRAPKGSSEKRSTAEKREYIRHCRPRSVSIAEGCRLMRIGRSTFLRLTRARPDHRCGNENDLRRVRSLSLSACWRRATPSWHCRERKKIRRLMREHELKSPS
jgi:hypothetical protein